MRARIFAGVLLLIAATSQAATIDAPAYAVEHELVRCSTLTPGDKFAWFVEPITEPALYRLVDYIVVEGGRACFFTGAPGKYKVTLTVDSESTAVGVIEITSKAGSAPAEMKPVEPTPPEIELSTREKEDPDIFGIVAIVKASPPADVNEAAALKSHFQNVANGLSSGELSGSKAAEMRLNSLVQSTFVSRASRDRIEPFLKMISQRFESLWRSGRLRNVNELARAYGDVAKGL